MGVWSASLPGRLYPGKEPVPVIQEAGWAPEPLWIGAENLLLPGFDPRTLQAVASRYTGYAIPALVAIPHLLHLGRGLVSLDSMSCYVTSNKPLHSCHSSLYVSPTFLIAVETCIFLIF